MRATYSAPLLHRVKSWQLVGLGIAGWVTLYSIAVINWASCSAIIGNMQGGCFATTMTLASFEARRLNKFKGKGDTHALHWADKIPTLQLNHALEQIQQKKGFTTETLHDREKGLGFGVRAVKDGRTFVFETSRWKNPIIDLVHAQTTNENRKRTKADLAVIVSIGVPDEGAKRFVKSVPLQLLAGGDLQKLIEAELPKPEIKAKPDGKTSV